MLHTRHQPQSNGMSEAFVKTLKRVYVRISTLPDAETALRQISQRQSESRHSSPIPPQHGDSNAYELFGTDCLSGLVGFIIVGSQVR